MRPSLLFLSAQFLPYGVALFLCHSVRADHGTVPLAAALRDECAIPVVGEDLVGADGVLLRAEHAPLHGVAEVLVVRILHRLGELCSTEVVVEDELPVGDGAVGVALHAAAVKEPAAPLVALDEDPVAVLQRNGVDRRLFAVCLALCCISSGSGMLFLSFFMRYCWKDD